MMGMASPTGYLDLEQPAVTSATEVGTSTVDGVAVTQYELTIDPSSLASAPGTSSEEQSTINAAIQTLTSQGYRTIHDLVSIDASGFIRESASTVTFGDGGTVTLDAHFSNFGCAGTVLMPGQGGISTPPSGCVSADTGAAPTTTTTTTTTTTGPNQQPRRPSHPPRRSALHDDSSSTPSGSTPRPRRRRLIDDELVHDDDRLRHSRRGGVHTMAESEEHEGLWFDDPPGGTSRPAKRRRVWVVVASVACIAALAVPVTVALSSSGPSAKPAKTAAPHLTRGVAERQVISALSATTSSGSFNVSYEFDPPTPPTVTTTTTTAVPTCHVIVVSPGTAWRAAPLGGLACGRALDGRGMLRSQHRRGPTPNSPHHGPRNDRHRPLRDGRRVERARARKDHPSRQRHRRLGVRWCRLRARPGISETGPGASLSGFAGLVEGTLGARQGALAMGGLSSPTGYLDLDQSMITGADQTGTGTVDGVPVTIYEISIDPGQVPTFRVSTRSRRKPLRTPTPS